MIKSRIFALLTASLIGIASFLPVSAGPGLTPVNITTRGIMEDLIFMIAIEKKYFEKEGIDVRMVPVRGGGAAAITALAAGTADVTSGTYIFPLNEMIKKAGIKMVADTVHAEKGKPAGAYFLIRKTLADKVKSYSDLKGLRAALPSIGSIAHIRFLRKLEAAGLKESDLDAKNYPLNMRPILMANNAIDFGYFIEPQASLLAATGMAVVFDSGAVSDATYPSAMLYYSARLLRNPTVARGFMVAYLRAVRSYYSMSKSEINMFVSKEWGEAVSPAAIDSLFINPDGLIDTAYILDAQDYAVKNGFTKVRLSENELFDVSFAGYAAQVLNKEEADAVKSAEIKP